MNFEVFNNKFSWQMRAMDTVKDKGTTLHWLKREAMTWNGTVDVRALVETMKPKTR